MEMDELKRKIIEVGNVLIEEKLTHGTCGNISCRIGDKIIITPSSFPYQYMKEGDLLVLNEKGEIIEGERNPSVETPFHLSIYKKRQDVNAVIHTHSEWALAVSSVVDKIPVFLDEIFSYIGGEIKVAKYALPGSEELAENVVSALDDRNAILLSNHGAIACGKDLEEALEVARNVERICRIYAIASSLGKIRELPDEGKEYQRGMFELKRNL